MGYGVNKLIFGIAGTEEPHLFTTSTILKSTGVIFQPKDEKTWLVTYKNREYMITFYPDVFDEIPSLILMNFGEPLFAELLRLVQNQGKRS